MNVRRVNRDGVRASISVARNSQRDPIKPNPDSKLHRVLAALHVRSLNRFEAEELGDHTLNSTVSKLRGMGHVILGEWERVPSRFSRDVRVMRYRAASTGGSER